MQCSWCSEEIEGAPHSGGGRIDGNGEYLQTDFCSAECNREFTLTNHPLPADIVHPVVELNVKLSPEDQEAVQQFIRG